MDSISEKQIRNKTKFISGSFTFQPNINASLQVITNVNYGLIGNSTGRNIALVQWSIIETEEIMRSIYTIKF